MRCGGLTGKTGTELPARPAPTASKAGYVSISVPMPHKGTVGLLTQVSGVQLIPDRTIKVV